jgi:hypothetical protein
MYTLSICVKSMEKEYLIKNAGWLAGEHPTYTLQCIRGNDEFEPIQEVH